MYTDKLNIILDLLGVIEELASDIDFPVGTQEEFDDGIEAVERTIKALLEKRMRAMIQRIDRRK